jgi:hypothetical protein
MSANPYRNRKLISDYQAARELAAVILGAQSVNDDPLAHACLTDLLITFKNRR